MRRLLLILVAVAGTLVPATAARADQSPSGSIGIRLLDAPTDRRTDPRAHSYIVDHLAPGTTITRHLDVDNGTSTTQNISVYPAAATIAHGAFTFADGATANELSTWTHVDPKAMALAARTHRVVAVTITVPKDASPGERYAVVWAQVAAAPSSDGVAEVSRVGIRVYLSIGPGGEPASDFSIDTLTAERTPAGQPVVRARIHNTGGRALDMSGSLRLSDGPGSLAAGPFPARLGTTVAIGDTEDVTIALDPRLPVGPWHAHLDLRSGLLTRSADATLTFPTHAGSAEAVQATAATQTSPWLSLKGVVGVALLAALALLLLRRRRNRASDQGNSPALS